MSERLESAPVPRVLLLTASAFNAYTGGGITLTNLFRGWPIDRLAAAHTEVVPTHGQVCTRFYRLSPRELGGIWPRRLVSGPGRAEGPDEAGGGAAAGSPPRGAAPRARPAVAFARGILDRVAGPGALRDHAWLSPELAAFVADFRPQVLYTLLGSLGFVRLVRQVGQRFALPVVVHLMDDWPATRYARGLFAPLLQPRLERELRGLLEGCAARLVIGEAMREDYERRYGLSFTAFHNVLDVAAWEPHVRHDWGVASPARILYSGSILEDAQRDSLRDVAEAVGGLRAEGVEAELHVHTPLGLADPQRGRLERPPAVVFGPPLAEETIASTLAAADVLVLPVNFDAFTARYVRLSFPTKLPAYLLSGSPVLAYGPETVEQIRLARAEGWGRVVGERSRSALTAALRELLLDRPLRERLGRRAQQVARAQHDAAQVRPRFADALRQAAEAGRAGSAILRVR